MKVCDKTCIFFFFPIINKYFLMAKRSLLSRCPRVVASAGLALLSRSDSEILYRVSSPQVGFVVNSGMSMLKTNMVLVVLVGLVVGRGFEVEPETEEVDIRC